MTDRITVRWERLKRLLFPHRIYNLINGEWSKEWRKPRWLTRR